MGTNSEVQPVRRKSSKIRKFIKFSPSLRKKKGGSGKENAAMTSAGARDVMDSSATSGQTGSGPVSNGLSDREKHDLQTVFEMFDKNKDGKISCEELGVVLRTMGHRYSRTEVEDMIKNADKNDNGYVEYDEFLLLMKKWATTPTTPTSTTTTTTTTTAAATATTSSMAHQREEELRQAEGEESTEAREAREAFRIFDVDGNGYIDRHELRFIMSRLGECPGEEDICDMFRCADINGDGLIDYEEFTLLMAAMTQGAGAKGAATRPASATTRTSSRQ